MIGELPASSQYRGYWRLSNTDDASGNSRNFTNVGPVTFGVGKFGNAAMYGTSGTKGLDFAGNVVSTLKQPDITYSLWFKLNDTTASNLNARLWVFSSVADGTTDGCFNLLAYNISGGTITLISNTRLTTTNAALTFAFTPDTNWHNVIIVKDSTVNLSMYLDGRLVDSDTGVGTDVSDTQTPAATLTLGNERASGKASQVWADLDEFIFDERPWSASDVRKYYSQARGFLAA